MAEVAVYKGHVKPDWCPGCGDYGTLNALITAISGLDLDPAKIVIVSGIGCSSNLPGFTKVYGWHGLHGRSLPVAEGIKLANPELTVIATGGDGDGYGIGVGHFVHLCRRNIDITYLVMDNQVYGLTTGQVSPTSVKGHKTKTTPQGNLETPINPVALALGASASFVARAFAGDQKHTAALLQQAIRHKGFALVDEFSPCVTYNKLNTHDFFRERIYRLEESGHDPSDLHAAWAKAHEWGEKIPIGLFFRQERETLEEQDPALAAGPLVKQPLRSPRLAEVQLEFT